MAKSNSAFAVDDYTIEISKSLCIDHLKHDWIRLQNLACPPFFLTWSWISNWVHTYDPELFITKVFHKKNLVAIALFSLSTQVRHKILHSKQLLLHQTGNAARDQIWIEYNDMIANPEHRKEALNACLRHLSRHFDQHEEIIISMMASERAQEVRDSGIKFYITARKSSYAVNLNSIKTTGKDFLQSLSRNTRYQIVRSKKQYESQLGEVSIIKAETRNQALKYFNSAGELHAQRWADSGFKNPEFIKFHKKLIHSCFGRGEIDVFRISSGKSVIGYLYNFVLNKKAYFYLSGLKYEVDRKLKPGFVAHSLAIQYYMDANFEVYDFMGGESQYKKSLSTNSSEFISLRIQKPSAKFKMESLARKLKNKITGLH